MASAQLEEFGPDPGVATFPTKFFRNDVYVYQGDVNHEGKEIASTRTQVRPRYCATAYGASLMSTVLGGAAETPLLCPLNPAGLQFGWQTTANTPYLVFMRGSVKGAPINAGFLLDYYTHGYPSDLALQMAQMEVEASFNA
jgi:hypothetical protein